MIVKEVCIKSILSPSKIYPPVINSYTGCQHGCPYCYAHFMKRVTGHREPRGGFVDVKIDAAELLRGGNTEEETGESMAQWRVRPVPAP